MSSVRSLRLLVDLITRRYPELHADLLTPPLTLQESPENLRSSPPSMASVLGSPGRSPPLPRGFQDPLFVDPDTLPGVLREILSPLNLQLAAERHAERERRRKEQLRKERGFLGMVFGGGGGGQQQEPSPAWPACPGPYMRMLRPLITERPGLAVWTSRAICRSVFDTERLVRVLEMSLETLEVATLLGVPHPLLRAEELQNGRCGQDLLDRWVRLESLTFDQFLF